MFTVALIGPDGAGKTTVGRRLLQELPLPVRYLYMGVNSEASNRRLLTTSVIRGIKRLCGAKPDTGGPPPLPRESPPPRGIIKRTLRTAKSFLSLANRMGDELYRQVLTWFYEWQGSIVLYDRHYFIDYYAYDIAPCDWQRPLARRIHGYFLNHIYPKPDLVVYLDAPSEVLFARKGEGTLEALDRRRREYLELRHHVPHFAVVDATQSLDDVVDEVLAIIVEFHAARTNKCTNKCTDNRPDKTASLPASRSLLSGTPCDAGIELSLSTSERSA